MKHLLIIIGLIVGIDAYAQNNIPTNKTNDTIRYTRKVLFVENDTVFLSRVSNNSNGFHYFEDVYIETNRQSTTFQRVLNRAYNILLDQEEKEYFDDVVKRYKDINKQESLVKHPVSDISKGWIPLQSFQGKYYINSIDIFQLFWITDSLYIRNYMDGPTPYIIHSFKKVSPTHYQIHLGQKDSLIIDFYIIDDKKKIAIVVKSMPKSDHKEISLFVSSETAHLFDLIAWNSSQVPYDHIVYDKIDFQKLILKYE